MVGKRSSLDGRLTQDGVIVVLKKSLKRRGDKKLHARAWCKVSSPTHNREAVSEVGSEKRGVIEFAQWLAKQIDANSGRFWKRKFADAKNERRG